MPSGSSSEDEATSDLIRLLAWQRRGLSTYQLSRAVYMHVVHRPEGEVRTGLPEDKMSE